MAALKQIGDIEVFAEIGQSATTLVYKGFQSGPKRFVLLKVLRPEFNTDEELVARIHGEAKLIARIKHKNVISVYDSGEVDHLTYLATEFVDGMDLGRLLKSGKMPEAIALLIITLTARGLKAAHDKGILHSDIKPSNILISNSGEVKLCDFGMAEINAVAGRGTEPEIRGTLGYFSPEALMGQPLGPHSDIFSLGATFYEMLTGIPAFYGENSDEYIHAVVNDDPINFLQKAGVVEGTVDVCKKMLAKKPRDRYRDCAPLIHDLEMLKVRYGLRTSQKELTQFLGDPVSYSGEILREKGRQPSVTSSRVRIYSVVILFVVLAGWLASNLPFGQEQPEQPPVQVKSHDRAVAGEPPLEKPTSGAIASNVPQRKIRPTASESAHAEPSDLAVESVAGQGAGEDVSTIGAPVGDEAVSATGFLHVTCKPWAGVFVDGDSVGITPLADAIQLPSGQHDIMLSNPDFPRHYATIEIKPEETSDLEFSFWSIVGRLQLEVSPWAEVFIDGDYRDTIPPQKRPIILSPGAHTLNLKHPSFGEWQTELNIKAGENLALQFNLRTLLRN